MSLTVIFIDEDVRILRIDALKMSSITAAALIMLSVAAGTAATIPTVVRGEKVYTLKPEMGPLEITVSKRDMNIYEDADVLKADLYGPGRMHLGHLEIPDDGVGQKGPMPERTQTETMTVECQGPGTYRLVIMCPARGDFVHGVQTSSGTAMVEGMILLNNAGVGGRIYFAAPEPETTIRAQALHNPGRQQMPLYDASGAQLKMFDISETGNWQELEVSEDLGDRTGPWYFDCSKMDIRCEIDGLEYFTIGEEDFFPAASYRHMLFPYNATRYLQPGESAELTYTLRNNTGTDDTFAITAGDVDGLSVDVVDPVEPVEIPAKRYANLTDLTVRVEVPDDAAEGDELLAPIVAASEGNEELIESAIARVIVGESPVSEPLEMPIVLEPYQHENYQFGYAPEYVENEVYFDLDNRPYIRHRTIHKYPTRYLQTLIDGEWVQRPFIPAVEEAYPDYRGFYMGGGALGAKWAFDGDNGAYTTVHMMRTDHPFTNVLIFTPDAGESYSVYDFKGDRHDIEQFTGHNALPHPPPVLGYEQTEEHEERFCSYHNLWLYTPERNGDEIEMGEPVLVSDRCLGSCQHSGGPASTVTRDGKTHVVWGEVTEEDVPGVPTYIATYDHETEELGEPVFMAYAPPVNDVHNVPAVTMDSEGYIHVVTGAHGDTFKYRRSSEPNDAYSGWTDTVPVLTSGRVEDDTDEDGRGAQTYCSLVCDQDDNLHIAYRQWRGGVDEYHGGSLYAALSVQTKPKAGEWGPARPLVIPVVNGYSIYYHKLTTDRKGNLYLSYSYWTNHHVYQPDFPEHFHNRAVIVSKDQGETWKLAQTQDFKEEIITTE